MWRRAFDAAPCRPGRLVTDAQIAATALGHGGVVFSNDLDFGRFPGVRVINPLKGR